MVLLGGGRRGVKKSKIRTWRHLVLYKRLTSRGIEMQEGLRNRKYYLRDGITELGEAGSLECFCGKLDEGW